MMETSARHQKQKLNPIKPRLFARSIVRQFTPLSEIPLKRIGIVSASLAAGVGVPALVFASQQPAAPTKTQPSQPSTVTITHSAASSFEEAASFEGPSTLKSPSSPSTNTAEVSINGEKVTTDMGSVEKSIVTTDGSHVDVEITIESSGSSASHSSTDVSISSNTNSDIDTRHPPRGSPGR